MSISFLPRTTLTWNSLLSRAHDNYLAQINIRMNERQESTSKSLNNLTILGTIVLPMNIITGMWGMNVLVPGQNINSLHWFFSSMARSSTCVWSCSNRLSSHWWSISIWCHMFLHGEEILCYRLICKEGKIVHAMHLHNDTILQYNKFNSNLEILLEKHTLLDHD